METTTKYRSKLSRAKGLGASGHAVSHWMLQRLTAIALIPLSVWFIASLLHSLISGDVFAVADWLSSPINAVAMVLMLLATFIHAKLGLQVVIEDYIKCPAKKYTLLILNTFMCFILSAASIMAVLKLHFIDILAAGF